MICFFYVFIKLFTKLLHTHCYLIQPFDLSFKTHLTWFPDENPGYCGIHMIPHHVPTECVTKADVIKVLQVDIWNKWAPGGAIWRGPIAR